MSVRIEWDESGLEHLQDAASAHLKDLAEQIADDAKAGAPVATGKLRDSIHVEPSEDGKSFTVIADATYAAVVEAGTATRPANPFLRNAAFKARS